MPLVLGELVVLYWIVGRSTWRERTPGARTPRGNRRDCDLELLANGVRDAAGRRRSGLPEPSRTRLVATQHRSRRGGHRRFAVAFVLAPEPFLRSAGYVHVGVGVQKGMAARIDDADRHLGISPGDPRVLGRARACSSSRRCCSEQSCSARSGPSGNERRRAAMLGAAVTLIVVGPMPRCTLGVAVVRYEQWKWIAFFEPAFVVAVFSLVVAAGGSLLRRWGPNPRRMSWAIGAVLGAVLVATSARTLVNGDAVHPRGLGSRRAGTSLEPRGAFALETAERPGLVDSKSVDINLPQWDEMWAAVLPTAGEARLSPGPELLSGDETSRARCRCRQCPIRRRVSAIAT